MICLEEAAKIGEAVTGVAAVLALCLGYWQVRRTEKLSRSENAYKAYDDYVRLCIEYPMFTHFELARKEYNLPAPEKVWMHGSINSERYLWFVANMLNCFERIILAVPRSKRWMLGMKVQVKYHLPVIKVVWPTEWRKEYSRNLRKLVEEAIEEPTDA